MLIVKNCPSIPEDWSKSNNGGDYFQFYVEFVDDYGNHFTVDDSSCGDFGNRYTVNMTTQNGRKGYMLIDQVSSSERFEIEKPRGFSESYFKNLCIGARKNACAIALGYN